MNRAIGGSMLRKDDPEHAKERRPINPTLRVKAVQEIWRPVFERNAARYLEQMLQKGPGADLNEDFAAPYAATNLAAIVGLPGVDWTDIRRWSLAFIDGTANSAEDIDIWRVTEAAGAEVEALLDEAIPYLLKRPDDSMLSAMLQARLPTPIIRANTKLTIAGGVNEPQHMITSAVWALATHPRQLAAVMEDSSLFGDVFDEVARWLSPVGMISRRATRDVEIGGVLIESGSLVGASIQSANRDSGRFLDPDTFDVLREKLPNYAFGSGSHMCAGRWAAESAVGHVALPLLYSRLPKFRPVDVVAASFKGWTFRGLESLPVMWEPAPTGRQRAVDAHDLVLRVDSRMQATEDVVVLELSDPTGKPLPAWEPGAHLTLKLSVGLERQYSLCGDASDPLHYKIAVLREPGGRGGSDHVHNSIEPGALLEAAIPKNHFPLLAAPEYKFVVGGIGITPILPMIKAAEAAGSEWSLLYLGSSRSRMPFLDTLSRYGQKVTAWPKDERGRASVESLIQVSGPSCMVYSCGPEALLSGLKVLSESWPKGSLRVEHFSPVQTPEIETSSFSVEIGSTGEAFNIPVGTSIVDVLENAGIPVLSSCMEGTCGTCEVAVLAGRPCHRDSVLSEEEREKNTSMMICVSRASTPSITLDL